VTASAGHPSRYTIGLISDTHGLLRADVFTALAGVDLLLHAIPLVIPDWRPGSSDRSAVSAST
jgi:hypothetical protein